MSGLLQQIRLLELEVDFLKKGGQTDVVGSAAAAAAAEGEAGRELRINIKQNTPTPTPPTSAAAPLTDRLREEMHALRSELSAKSQRLESLSAENMQLQVGRSRQDFQISNSMQPPIAFSTLHMYSMYSGHKRN